MLSPDRRRDSGVINATIIPKMQISSLSSSSLAPIIVRNTVIYAGHGRNIRLTWEAELAQLLPSEATSKSCDKPLTQVEAIVLHPCRACKKFCVNGYTTQRREYGHFQGDSGRVAQRLQGTG